MKFLKWAGVAIGAVAVVAATLYLFRTDPIFMVSGKRLSGDELPYPSDWSICNDHQTVAVETRLDDPHSITTGCFVHQGELFIPAQTGSDKQWTAIVARDPRIRLKIGEYVYPARAERITDFAMQEMLPSIAAKYPRIAELGPEQMPQDVWMFRITSR